MMNYHYFIILVLITVFATSTSTVFAGSFNEEACPDCADQEEDDIGPIVIGGSLNPIIIENPAPSSTNLFGLSSSISENRLLIQAHQEENEIDKFGNQVRKQTSQMFLFDCTQLTECALADTIVIPSTQFRDVLGTYSKMDWPYVVITAPEFDVDLDNDGFLEKQVGVAYFFDCTGNNCTLVDTISNPNPGEGSQFGRFVSMSGTLVAISSPFEEIDGVKDAGQVYLFDCSGNGCSLVDSIPNPTPVQSGVFGTLSISGTNLAVGEINAKIEGVRKAGQVYLFDCSGNSCSLVDTIPNPDPKEGARFGNYISISGSLVAISHQQYTYAVYLYDCSGNSCTLVDALQDPKKENEETIGFKQFGFGTEGVTLVDHTLAVSNRMTGEDIDGSRIIENDETQFGEVYLYDCSSTGCTLFETLKNPTPARSDFFGEFFSLQSENRILVGAPHAGQRGEVYFFNEQVPPIEPSPEPTPESESESIFVNGAFTKNGITWCAVEKPLYDLRGDDTFFEHHKHSIESRICAKLYEDPFWNYNGSDRIEKLIDRSLYYSELEIAESQLETGIGVVDPTPADAPESMPKIPEWVRNIFVWYAEERISEDELLGAIQFLIDQGILKS